MLLLASVTSAACAQSGPLPLPSIKLPPGFTIELVARVDNARQMVLGPQGTLFVGSMQSGKVYAVRWKPGAPAEVLTLASGLSLPVGVAFHGGALCRSRAACCASTTWRAISTIRPSPWW